MSSHSVQTLPPKMAAQFAERRSRLPAVTDKNAKRVAKDRAKRKAARKQRQQGRRK